MRYIRLNEAVVACDFAVFSEAISAGHLENALEVYNGKFLDNAPYVTDDFDDWRISTAAHCEAEATAACISLVSDALEKEEHARAAELARRGLIIDPDNEYLARVRIESLASGGEFAAALRELELTKRRLASESNSPPTWAEALYQQISRLPVLQDTHDADPSTYRFVGRAVEVRQLKQQWLRVRQGCRVAMIRGKPGVGKSRLLHHLTRRAVLDGARAFTFRCSEVESRLSFSAIVGVIRDGIRQADLDQLDERWLVAIASIAPELLPGIRGSVEPTRIVWEAIAQFFFAVSRAAPVVVAIDDFHWCDESSKEVLVYVSKRLAETPILISVAARGGQAPPAYEDDTDITLVVDLEDLSAAAASELVDEFVARHNISIAPAARGLLCSRTGGRPFYLTQVLRHIESQQIKSLTVEGLREVLPPSVESYVGRRLTEVSPCATSLAAVAAILHRGASLHLLARINGSSVVAAATAVDELIKGGIFADVPQIQFTHEIIRDAVLSTVSVPQRQMWHARIAAVLCGEDPERHGEIAFHYEQAGQNASACRAAQAAISSALDRRAYAELEEQYERMMRCSTGATLLHAKSEYFKFKSHLGAHQDVAHLVAEVEPLYRKSADYAGLLACALSRYGSAEAAGGQAAGAGKHSAREIVRLCEEHAPELIAEVLWHVADALRRAGEYGLLGYFARELDQRARNPDIDQAAAAEMMTVAAITGGLSEGYEFALHCGEIAVSLANQAGGDLLRARAAFARGTARLWGGQLDKARMDYDRVRGAATESTLQDDLLVRVTSNYAVILMEQAEYGAAEEYALSALRQAGAARRGYCYGNLALLHVRSGNWSAARRYCEALTAFHSNSPQSWIPLHVQGLLGLVDLGEGLLESACERAVFVEAHLGADNGVIDCTHLYLLRAAVAQRRGDLKAAATLLEDGFDNIASKEAIAGARLLVALADVYAAGGDLKRASELLEDTIQMAERGAVWSIRTEAEQVIRSRARATPR